MDKGMEMQKGETQSWIPNLSHLQCSVLLFAGYSLWTSFSLAEDLTPLSSDGKASVYNAGDPGSIPWSGRSPGEGKGYPLPYSCLENSMDQDTVHGVQSMGSLGYSPWGRKESDTTEWLHFEKCEKQSFSPDSSLWICGLRMQSPPKEWKN